MVADCVLFSGDPVLGLIKLEYLIDVKLKINQVIHDFDGDFEDIEEE